MLNFTVGFQGHQEARPQLSFHPDLYVQCVPSEFGDWFGEVRASRTFQVRLHLTHSYDPAAFTAMLVAPKRKLPVHTHLRFQDYSEIKKIK